MITKHWMTKTARGMRRSERNYGSERCRKKVAHPNWDVAESELIRILEDNRHNGLAEQHNDGLASYRCRHCDFWHIGHSRGPNISFFAGLHPEKAQARGKAI